MRKVKTLFLSYNGLLEPILTSQAIPYLAGLARMGYGVVLLTYEKKDDLKNSGGMGAVREIKADLKSRGIEWHYLKYHKSPPFFAKLFDIAIGIIYTFYLIRSRRVNIVHVRGITAGVIMIALSKMAGVKILFDMRGLLAEEYVGGGLWKDQGISFKLVKIAERRLLTRADAVTVLTRKHFDLNKSIDFLRSRNIPTDVIPCCVDMSRFGYNRDPGVDLRERIGLKDKFVLMYPGKIGTFYFVDEMLMFFNYLLKVVPETVFLVVTRDGWEELMSRVRAIGASLDKIKVIQNIPFAEMPLYMRIADAGIFFINPYKKFGSSPIKMGEFLASGVPVIINPGIGDTEEMVRENNVGVVVKDFNENGYAQGVSALLRLRAEGSALKARCRDTAAKYLSLEEGIAKYANIYDILSRDII